MAENSTANEDPSIEEILDSIRQIISEDDSSSDDDADFDALMGDDGDDADFEEVFVEAPPPPPPPPPPPAPVQPAPQPAFTPEPEPEDDILELTDKVEDAPSIEVDLIDMDDTPAFTPEPEPEPEPLEFNNPFDEDEDEDSIFTQAAENAALGAMASLVRKTAVEHNGITLEEIVRTELKPMLRGWLDKNLPVIIERLVREELERISKRALDE